MKIFLLLFLAIIGITQNTKGDTIDYWHVYYNKIKIAEFNSYNTHDISIKINKVKNGDIITVRYYRDTPGSDLVTNLTVVDEKHHVILVSKGKGTGNPVSFALKDLLEYKKKHGGNTFEIFYTDSYLSSIPAKLFLFRIKFE